MESKPLKTKQNYRSVPKPIKNCRNRTKNGLYGAKYFKSKSSYFLENPKSRNGSTDDIFGRSEYSIFGSVTFHTHCYCLFLVVVILAAGIVLRPIFARRFPTRYETLETSTHARSLTLKSSTGMVFCHETLLKMIVLDFWDGNRLCW